MVINLLQCCISKVFTVDRLSIVRGAASLVPMAHTGGSDDEEGDGEEEA